MKHKMPRIPTLVALALAAVVGAAVVMQLDQPGTRAAISSPAIDTSDTAAQPAAACRMRPECSTNSDCDERCGAGQGKCVHSSCPIRVCRCN